MASKSLNNNNHKEHFIPPWTRLQNKQFEKALVLFDEHTPDRWQNIAKEVGNKSVEEVERHYAILLEDLGRIESGRVPIPDYKFSENMNDHAERVEAYIAISSGQHKDATKNGAQAAGSVNSKDKVIHEPYVVMTNEQTHQ
ncbi:protein RADIALIS-like 4 [Glycine soja]|uniref:protein RADIALIS-like 4 n=1 Tax=Glycine soja TaxID=3848 RepID=UPI00103A6503|nr:protein RADIALIS-like 4 [Glycine soja]